MMKKILLLLFIFSSPLLCYCETKSVLATDKPVKVYNESGRQVGYLKKGYNGKVEVHDVYGNSKGYCRSTTTSGNSLRYYSY